MSMQWRNKVAVGPRASIPKGPPLPPKKTFKKQRRARVHCTPCTPYCYATGKAHKMFNISPYRAF